MKLRRALIGILPVLALAGCQYDPWAHQFLKSQPAERDIVGLYVVDQASLQRTITLFPNGAPLRINPSARIILSADHSAEFYYVPRDIDDLWCSVTGHGTWRLGKNDNVTVVRAQIVDVELDDHCKNTFTAAYGQELDLFGKKPPYKLHVTIGDPDSGDAVQFVRGSQSW